VGLGDVAWNVSHLRALEARQTTAVGGAWGGRWFARMFAPDSGWYGYREKQIGGFRGPA
jgi:hypothetical protein